MSYVFNGREMKAIASFSKDEKISALSTPFFFNGKVYATDSFCAVCFDLDGGSPYDYNEVWSVAREPLKKILVKDRFVFRNDLTVNKNQESFEMVNSTARARIRAERLDQVFDLEGTPIAQNGVAVMGFNPKFIKKAIDLADAFKADRMDFEFVPYGNAQILRVAFPEVKGLKAAIAPMLNHA